MHFKSPVVAGIAASLVSLTSTAWGALPADGATIESLTGLKGTWNAKEGVFKVSKPRDDVKITVDRVAMPPFMGFTSYAAFVQAGDALMMMGDTVLLEDEVDAAMSAALDAASKSRPCTTTSSMTSPRSGSCTSEAWATPAGSHPA